MKIAVIGTGYVGLVQGAVFADIGHDVICVDSLEEKIKSIENFCATGKGELPVHEPGLSDLVKINYDNGRLKFSTDIKKAVEDYSALFITVGTPTSSTGHPDLSYVYKVTEEIGDAINSCNGINHLIVLKSTVPVNTHKEVSSIIHKKTKKPFYIVSNPEFMAQGRAVKDCKQPSRIVIGAEDDIAVQHVRSIYHPIISRWNTPVEVMDNVSAELCKYVANAYLALQVDATNKFAELSRRLGGDWDKIKKAIKHDNRIGKFVHAGLGFGGSCFEKDVSALAKTMEEAELFSSAEWLEQAILKNDYQRKIMVNRIREYFSGKLDDKTIAIWGLSFKPDTNDVRGAASIPSIIELVADGAKIMAYDPAAIDAAKAELSKLLGCKPENKGIFFCSKKEDALKDSDALLITVEWPEFLSPDFEHIKKELKQPSIFDGKDLYDVSLIRKLGFDYFSVGRPDVKR